MSSEMVEDIGLPDGSIGRIREMAGQPIIRESLHKRKSMWLNSPRSQQNRGNWGIYKVEALCYHEIHRLIVIALRLSRYRGKRNNNQSFLLQFLPKRMSAKREGADPIGSAPSLLAIPIFGVCRTLCKSPVCSLHQLRFTQVVRYHRFLRDRSGDHNA